MSKVRVEELGKIHTVTHALHGANDTPHSDQNKVQYNNLSDTACDLNNRAKLFDINGSEHEKFMYLLMQKPGKQVVPHSHCVEYERFKKQSKYKFGYIPLSPQVMPEVTEVGTNSNISAIDLHSQVKEVGVANVLGARIPVNSQLNVQKWEEYLENY